MREEGGKILFVHVFLEIKILDGWIIKDHGVMIDSVQYMHIGIEIIGVEV